MILLRSPTPLTSSGPGQCTEPYCGWDTVKLGSSVNAPAPSRATSFCEWGNSQTPGQWQVKHRSTTQASRSDGLRVAC